MYVFGVCIMLVSDCQKYYQLKYTKNQLIMDGMFKYNRNPNYFGEMLVYTSFAIISEHMISYFINFFVWCTVFLINITCKEYSLS